MTAPDSADVAEIARGLTKAQQRAVLAARQGAREKQPWINIGMGVSYPTLRALYEAKLVDYHDLPARLTPLGLLVRTHLERTAR